MAQAEAGLVDEGHPAQCRVREVVEHRWEDAVRSGCLPGSEIPEGLPDRLFFDELKLSLYVLVPDAPV